MGNIGYIRILCNEKSLSVRIKVLYCLIFGDTWFSSRNCGTPKIAPKSSGEVTTSHFWLNSTSREKVVLTTIAAPLTVYACNARPRHRVVCQSLRAKFGLNNWPWSKPTPVKISSLRVFFENTWSLYTVSQQFVKKICLNTNILWWNWKHRSIINWWNHLNALRVKLSITRPVASYSIFKENIRAQEALKLVPIMLHISHHRTSFYNNPSPKLHVVFGTSIPTK